jgi:uncharacterized protein YkwD
VNDLAQSGVVSHDNIGPPASIFPQQFFNCGYNPDTFHIGENIDIKQCDGARVVDEWMTNPEHRTNILDPRFRVAGVAIQQAANPNDPFGPCYTVEELGAEAVEPPPGSFSPRQAPARRLDLR